MDERGSEWVLVGLGESWRVLWVQDGSGLLGQYLRVQYSMASSGRIRMVQTWRVDNCLSAKLASSVAQLLHNPSTACLV